jgi:transketolase
VDTVRVLAADAVQKVGNGHPARRCASPRWRTPCSSA